MLPGGPLLNAYRGQTGHDGRLALPGLVFVGDAVATTTPTFGRGITTTLLQAQQLLRLIDEHGTDTDAIGESFDAWCTEQIKPWVDDHVHMDEATRRRWAGEDIDLSQPLPSDLILAAAEADPSIRAVIGGYLRMTELPDSPASRRTPRTRALRKRLAPPPGTRTEPQRTRRDRQRWPSRHHRHLPRLADRERRRSAGRLPGLQERQGCLRERFRLGGVDQVAGRDALMPGARDQPG